MKQKKTPERTCIGCREIRSKRDMIRIVCNQDGEISLDTTGRKAGRGAYLCPKSECMEKCLKAHGLERAFSRPIPREVSERLKEELKSLEQV
ncbi:MAG: YlxR family protein [Eubacteriales bacterium]|nr:YlxR family protein [Eubacteriales bacterium]